MIKRLKQKRLPVFLVQKAHLDQMVCLTIIAVLTTMPQTQLRSFPIAD